MQWNFATITTLVIVMCCNLCALSYGHDGDEMDIVFRERYDFGMATLIQVAEQIEYMRKTVSKRIEVNLSR